MNRHSPTYNQKKLCKEIQEIRNELEHINICISLPNSDFALRYVRQELFDQYAKKSNQLVIITNQVHKRTKKKRTLRQEKFFKH